MRRRIDLLFTTIEPEARRTAWPAVFFETKQQTFAVSFLENYHGDRIPDLMAGRHGLVAIYRTV